MSSNESSSDQDKLSAQIEAIQAEVRSIKGAMSGAKTARWLVLLGLLVLIGIFTGLGIGMVLEFQSSKNMDQLVTATQDRLEQSSDRYMAEVQTLVDFTTPRLTEAFYNQTKKDMPKYTRAFERERDQFPDRSECPLAHFPLRLQSCRAAPMLQHVLGLPPSEPIQPPSHDPAEHPRPSGT